MPKYYFDAYDSGTALRDDVGVEFGDLAEAAVEAASLLPEFARETVLSKSSHDFATMVRDESGEVVFRAAMAFRSQMTEFSDRNHNILVSGSHYEVTQSIDLRRENKMVRERVSKSLSELMSVLERTMASSP